MQFSHLHNHTQYSLLDGASSIKKLFKKAVADKMPAIAITDHGNMYGVFDFVKEANNYVDADGKLLVKPIIGCEFYLVTDRTIQQFTKEKKDLRYHQLLLAKNQDGYKNLMKLCTLGFTEGLYGKYPRIDKQLIVKYHHGLIATTCCLGASVPRILLKDGEEAAEKEFQWWLEIFGEDYYIELQRHDIPDQQKVNEVLVKWASKYNVKIIASNDSHYVDEIDSNAHDILLCLNTGEKQNTPKSKDFADEEQDSRNTRFAFYNNQFFFKTTEQMMQLFSDLPEAIDNTNEIVGKIDLVSVQNDVQLPDFQPPPPFTSQDDYLEFLVYEGAKIKYKIIRPEIEERIQYELGIIKKMKFTGYFLIVSDIIISAKKMGVIVGPGRGSAAGSIVAYCIDIISIDPLKYNLLFERFLNPDRAEMPDIDTDFDDIGRGKVVEYIVNKYGKNKVAHIITQGTMAAKSSIKDVARVLDLPLEESIMLSKLVPDKPGTSLSEMLHITQNDLTLKEGISPEDIQNVIKLQQIYIEENMQSTVLHEAEKLEGTIRNTGIHPAGILIGPKDLVEIMPLSKQKDTELLISQFSGNEVDKAGAIKIDILGLSNLSIIRNTIIQIKENHNLDLDIENISFEDEKTFTLYQNAETEGTFQFASPGMKKYLSELKPDSLNDLIAMNALFRPGPMAYIPEFILRKLGKKAVTYDLPVMEDILKETHGITVYQEQVMLLSQKLANFSKADADVLRKAMGKKQTDVLKKMKQKFTDGCQSNNHPLDICEKIWNDWLEFTKYGFNKAHATCYAYLAYQTAYLKANFPNEYMASVLNAQSNTEDISKYMNECKRMKLKVFGPDINESQGNFNVNKLGEIRFGLSKIKGLGENAISSIINERKINGTYTDIFDLVKRLESRVVSKKTLETLILSGALDSFDSLHRAQYFYIPIGEPKSNLEKILKYGQLVSNNVSMQTNSLFADNQLPDIVKPKMALCPPWLLSEKLSKEKDLLGIYISAHPLENFQFEMKNYHFTPLNEIDVLKLKNKIIRIGGYVSNAQHLISKKGNQYGKFKLTDFYGEYEIVIFGNQYVKHKDFITNDLKIMINGIYQLKKYSESEYEFNIHQIMLLEEVKTNLSKKLHIKIDIENINDAFINIISKYANDNGTCELGIQIEDVQQKEKLKLISSVKKIEISDELLQELENFKAIQFEIESN